MSSRPIIHIGMPKCASTWLQKHYFTPAHGFQPMLNIIQINLHFVYPRNFTWQRPDDLLKAQPREGLVPCYTWEMLSGNPINGGVNGETILYRLKESLPDAKVVIVIREQRAMWRSLYNLLVNWGYPYPVETILYNELPMNIPVIGLEYLNYHNIIQAYQRVFGEESVLVLPLEAFKANPADFLGQISTFSGIDLERHPINADAGKVENEKRSLVSLGIKRLYNRFVARTKLNAGGLYMPVRIQNKANFNPAVPAALNRWLETRFGRRVERMVGDYYGPSNRITETLTGLDLAGLGYRVTAAGKPALD